MGILPPPNCVPCRPPPSLPALPLDTRYWIEGGGDGWAGIHHLHITLVFAKDKGLDVIEDQTEVFEDRRPLGPLRECGCCCWNTGPASVEEPSSGFQMRRDVVKLDMDGVASP